MQLELIVLYVASLIIRSNQQVLNISEIINNHDATHIHI